jgi:predicted O-linked N-acetylglucosamine transferase (SPINDLY family)
VRGDSSDRPFTFGSLNNLMKINDHALSLWKRVLDAVPGSVLLFKTLALRDAQTRDELRARCERLGFDPARLKIETPPDGLHAHLDCYNRIDVALDTFPYNGTTTTTESFLMGVPVVAMRGRVHAARVSISLLENVGLGELLADTDHEYVQIAAALALDAPRLATLRTGLRARFLASPLGDTAAYAQRLEDAIVQMVTN